jgi:hypothetical protein
MQEIARPASAGKTFPNSQENNSDSLIGIEVSIGRNCGCGNPTLRLGPGHGVHQASLSCTRCGHHQGWISREAYAFVSEIVRLVGRPSQPIQVVRR